MGSQVQVQVGGVPGPGPGGGVPGLRSGGGGVPGLRSGGSKDLLWLRGRRYASCVHAGGLSCFKNYRTVNFKGNGHLIFPVLVRSCILHQITNTYNCKQ